MALSTEYNNMEELQAMISLLDDPDETIFSQIKSELLNRGRPALPVLEDAVLRQTDDPIAKRRIEEVITTIRFDETYTDLKQWTLSKEKDLLAAMLILSHYQYSHVDEDIVLSTVEEFVRYLNMELKEYHTAYEKIKVINRLLFDDFGLKGNTEDYFALDNCFINKVVDSKLGNPISLSALYMSIARLAGLPVFGVDLPHHFILAYVDADSPLGLAELQNRVLFYLNPFNKGIVFGRDEIDEFLRQLDITPIPAHYRPCQPEVVIKSLLRNIINICEREGYDKKAEEFKAMLGLFTDRL